jgi:hypothetical protein
MTPFATATQHSSYQIPSARPLPPPPLLCPPPGPPRPPAPAPFPPSQRPSGLGRNRLRARVARRRCDPAAGRARLALAARAARARLLLDRRFSQGASPPPPPPRNDLNDAARFLSNSRGGQPAIGPKRLPPSPHPPREPAALHAPRLRWRRELSALLLRQSPSNSRYKR